VSGQVGCVYACVHTRVYVEARVCQWGKEGEGKGWSKQGFEGITIGEDKEWTCRSLCVPPLNFSVLKVLLSFLGNSFLPASLFTHLSLFLACVSTRDALLVVFGSKSAGRKLSRCSHACSFVFLNCFFQSPRAIHNRV